MTAETTKKYLNDNLKRLFKDKTFTSSDKEELANMFIEFGRIVKYRCRSNIAYKNFLNVVFDGVVKIREQPVKTEFGKEFIVFKASVDTAEELIC